MRFSLLSLALAALIAWTGPARAQDAAPAPGYQTLVEQALSESAAGRWEEARAAFRKAHALYPNARTLRGIGMVAFEIRDYVDAVRHLELALLEPRRALDETQRREVVALLDQARGLVARYVTSGLPADAEIAIDGRPTRPEANGIVLVSLGEHRIQVKSGTRSADSRVTVRGGEYGALPIVLEEPRAEPAPIPAATAGAKPETDPTTLSDVNRESSPPTAATTAPNASEAEHGGVALGPLIATLAGAAVAVVGVVVLLSGLHDVSTVENARDGTEWSDLKAANSRAPIKTGLGSGLVALGGAVTVAGVIWFAVDGSTSTERAPAGDQARSVRVRVGGTW
jgi:hypothetical protein